MRIVLRALLGLSLLAALVALPEQADAQRNNRNNRNDRNDFRGGGGDRGDNRDPSLLWGIPDVRTGFYFCRLQYTWGVDERSGNGWRIEYPRADQNFPTRLAQLTATPISTWRYAPPARNFDTWDGMPGHTTVQATDPELFQCPIVFFSSAGSAVFSDEEVAALRQYLLKGGFLWGDDFWGERTWANLRMQMGRILPEHPIVQLKPGQDPVFQTFYSIQQVPQIPSLNNFRRMGLSSTSELGAESANAEMWAIMDGDRPMVVMTHNTDIADGWEREADLEVFFQRFAWQAYSIGVNVMMWIMTR
jgi:hypothetical protein